MGVQSLAILEPKDIPNQYHMKDKLQALSFKLFSQWECDPLAHVSFRSLIAFYTEERKEHRHHFSVKHSETFYQKNYSCLKPKLENYFHTAKESINQGNWQFNFKNTWKST